MNIDRLFSEVIGEFGAQQRSYAAILGLVNVYVPFQMLQYKFVAVDPPSFDCLTAEGKSLVGSCPNDRASECKSITYLEKGSSIVSEFDLVCDRSALGPFTMSTFMVGVMAGSITLGTMADRLGRRKMLLSTLALLLLSNAAASVAPNYNAYSVCRLSCGFFASGVILSSFVLLNELVGASKRGLVGVSAQFFFAIGIAALSAISFLCLHSWETLTQVITLLGVPILLAVAWYVPESPMWLQNQGRRRDAVRVLKRIAAGNGTAWDDGAEEGEACVKEEEAAKRKSSDTVLQLLTRSKVAKVTFIQLYSWFTCSATYYGLTLAAGGSDDLYMSTAMSGLVEVPAYILAVSLFPKLGRRKLLVLSMMAGGFACGSMTFVQSFPVLEALGAGTWLSLAGKLCISGAYAIVYVHSNEIFPTTIRNGGMGLVSCSARIGGILAPFMAKMGESVPNLHFVVFGLMALTSGALNSFLPETQNKPLPNDIDELVGRIVYDKCATPSKRSHASVN